MRVLLTSLLLMAIGANRIEAQSTKLTDIEGIGPSFAERLAAAGVKTQPQLLTAGGTAAGRDRLAAKTGIGAPMILGWVNRIDLARVKGIGPEYADLLEKAGVDSPKELARRNPESLREKLDSVNTTRKIVRRVPTLSQVTRWIANAKVYGSKVEH